MGLICQCLTARLDSFKDDLLKERERLPIPAAEPVLVPSVPGGISLQEASQALYNRLMYVILYTMSCAIPDTLYRVQAVLFTSDF